MDKRVHCCVEAANHQLPIAASFESSLVSVENVKLNAKFDAGLLLYSLSHFECNGHTVHMLTQQHLLPPLTSTVKSSLFMHAHSSLLSLAARLHQNHTNCSCYMSTMVGPFLDRPRILVVLKIKT